MKNQYIKPTVEVIDLEYFEAVARDNGYGIVVTSRSDVDGSEALSGKREDDGQSASESIWNTWGDK